MNFWRLYHSFRLCLIPRAGARAEYIRKNNIFGSMGKNCIWQRRKIPLYPQLIHIHDNVHIASNVGFVTHDVTHRMLNNINVTSTQKGEVFFERLGCIEIGDNVFVGAGTRILYNTRIGSNVVIAAGSVVTKDLPSGGVYAGTPARKISSFEEFVQKQRKYSEMIRKAQFQGIKPPKNGNLQREMSQYLWLKFLEERGETQ